MRIFERQTTPAEISSDLRALIDGLLPGATPEYVDVKPTDMDAQVNECFPCVARHVRGNGGHAINGWTLWELPSVFIEAEFHCVWKQSSGELLDITPKKYATQRILFLPDPFRIYEDQQVSNIRRPLRNTPDLRAYLATFDAEFELMNRDDLAHQHGLIALSSNDRLEYEAIHQLRGQLAFAIDLFPAVNPYSPCPCGSGKKVKWCHK